MKSRLLNTQTILYIKNNMYIIHIEKEKSVIIFYILFFNVTFLWYYLEIKIVTKLFYSDL